MLTNKCLVIVCATAFTISISMLVTICFMLKGDLHYIIINEQEVSVILPEDFLSIGIDASEIQDFHKVDFTNEKFRHLAAALSPARLRLGGTMSDRLIFSAEDLPSFTCAYCQNSTKTACNSLKKMCSKKFLPFFLVTGAKWTEINNFCKTTGLKLLFPFNVLLRNEHGWDQQNAMEIIKFSKKHKFPIDWQLGNEPNSFRHVFNLTITPFQLAQDFKKLRELLNKSGYEKSLVVGPDTTRPQERQPNCLKYMIEFLGNASEYINVRSWHQYYLNSRTVELEDFWNPDTFDLLNSQIQVMKNSTKQHENIPMWLTETSSSYGGGAPGLSNTYAGSPLWLDKLGLAARNNITTVVRQSLYGGNYSLIDENLEPLPDWWLSVLYKKLVGNKVLNITTHSSKYQRLYAHCSNRKYTNDTTAITLYGINLEMKKVIFRLNGTAFTHHKVEFDEFILSAPSNNRRSKRVLLNGWPLNYEYPIPDFEPRQKKTSKRFSLPPYSMGFWVIKNTSLNACK